MSKSIRFDSDSTAAIIFMSHKNSIKHRVLCCCQSILIMQRQHKIKEKWGTLCLIGDIDSDTTKNEWIDIGFGFKRFNFKILAYRFVIKRVSDSDHIRCVNISICIYTHFSTRESANYIMNGQKFDGQKCKLDCGRKYSGLKIAT